MTGETFETEDQRNWTDASVSLEGDFTIQVTTKTKVTRTRHAPPVYAWADLRYGVVHASIVEAQRNLLGALQGGRAAETTGADNLATLQLVEACYESARSGAVVQIPAP